MIFATAFILSACNWNKQTRSSEKVELVKKVYVGSCKYKGTVEAKVKEKIGGIKVLSDKKMRQELVIIAKNNAAEMGGDSITSASRIKNGRKTFKVYLCRR